MWLVGRDDEYNETNFQAILLGRCFKCIFSYLVWIIKLSYILPDSQV